MAIAFQLGIGVDEVLDLGHVFLGKFELQCLQVGSHMLGGKLPAAVDDTVKGITVLKSNLPGHDCRPWDDPLPPPRP